MLRCGDRYRLSYGGAWYEVVGDSGLAGMKGVMCERDTGVTDRLVY